MKTKLLIFSLLLMSSVTFAQVVANQVDNFEDGTSQNWEIGGAAAPEDMPTNVATDGPNGIDDNYLTYTSLGGGGPVSKMVIFNAGPSSQWSSNFTSENIVGIKMNVRVLTNNLNLRVAFQGNGTRICTTNAVTVTAGSGWSEIVIPISASDFTLISGGSTIETALTNVSAMRILSSDSPTWSSPHTIAATLHLDNITASTTLSTRDIETSNEFSISPNPATSKLNVFLPQHSNNATIAVYDVLGKRVFTTQIDALTASIDVSKWNSGVYLVRISTDNSTQTKRFVRQ
ncbi:T9SS type A sorting domain-containing protein [Psychroserpens ponticola]|uniref:T9SS type A sorting domain-containing protein n=1 Tax=Psychroserpens ponticola TaxID=2932268 RepID=A0ABY7RU30_9FLAO|nr:T9SS type A sorting domain-containing protein [Psychroserpens ponticola]WCO00625.1 T9SS type A sorting domain-containing protein [Psychroserpens ponticola]